MDESVLTKALADLIPHLLPRTATDVELRSRLSHSVQRYAERQLGSVGSLKVNGSAPLNEASLKEHVLTTGLDSAQFTAKLAQLKRALSIEQQSVLLSALSKAVQGMPDLASKCRSKAQHAEGLTDATNTITRQSDDWRLLLNTKAPSNPPSLGSASVHSSINAPATMAGPRSGTIELPPQQQSLVLEPSALSLARVPMPQQQQQEAAVIPAPVLGAGMGTSDVQMALRQGQVSEDELEQEMIRDVLLLLQGLTGSFVRAHPEREFEHVFTSQGKVKVPAGRRPTMLRFAAIGAQYKLIKRLVAEGDAYQRGLVHQALTSAINDVYVGEYYRFLAMMQSLSLKGELTFARLHCWLAETGLQMHVLAELLSRCQGLRGGEIVTEVHALTLKGAPLFRDCGQLLMPRVCVPLMTFISKWIHEGALDDPHGEFFVSACSHPVDAPSGQTPSGSVAAPVEADHWRDAYELDHQLVPSFISDDLAHKIVRAGKSINFLRQECGDVAWVQQATQMDSFALENEQPEEQLRRVVGRAVEAVDARLKSVVLERLQFMHHCNTLKSLLFFEQGDFASALLHQFATPTEKAPSRHPQHSEGPPRPPLLDRRANEVMPSELSNRLKKAFDGSVSAKIPEDCLERVTLRKATGGGTGALLADVLVLSYSLGRPLAALMPPRVMAQYEKISTFLFKAKTVEYKLEQSWLVLRRMQKLLDGNLREHIAKEHPMRHMLRFAARLRSAMSGFVRHLLDYSTNHVIEGAWTTLQADISAARNIDEVMAAHDKTLNGIVAACMLDSHTPGLRAALDEIYQHCHRVLPLLRECDAQITVKSNLLQQIDDNVQSGSWGAAHSPEEELVAQLTTAAGKAQHVLGKLDERFGRAMLRFLEQQSEARHSELRLLIELVLSLSKNMACSRSADLK